MILKFIESIKGELDYWKKIGAPGVPYIIGNEAAERFSYYGMKAILAIFMTDYLMMTESKSNEWFHLFGSAVYFMPIMRALLPDIFIGKYRTILFFSIFYCKEGESLEYYSFFLLSVYLSSFNYLERRDLFVFFFFCLISFLSLAQTSKPIEINGKITVENNDVDGITIFNISSNKYFIFILQLSI